MPKCALCGAEINKRTEDWVQPSGKGGRYYHRTCYESWRQADSDDDADYKGLIYDYISHDLKKTYNYYKCEAQRKKFNKENMTNKGILFALKYFYDVKHNDWDKGFDGIGIVPYIYKESCAYWSEQERRTKGIVEQIERQMREAIQQNKQVVVKKKVNPKKAKIDLSAIAEMEDDE